MVTFADPSVLTGASRRVMGLETGALTVAAVDLGQHHRVVHDSTPNAANPPRMVSVRLDFARLRTYATLGGT